MMSEEIPQITFGYLKEQIHTAFADPSIPNRGGLQAEVHIGQKQADEIFGTDWRLRNITWPVHMLGQKVYLIDQPSFFKVVAAGTFKKQARDKKR